MDSKKSKILKPSICFGKREELKAMRQSEFLALSGSERMSSYFRFLHESAILYGYKPKNKNSFKLSMLNRETEF